MQKDLNKPTFIELTPKGHKKIYCPGVLRWLEEDISANDPSSITGRT